MIQRSKTHIVALQKINLDTKSLENLAFPVVPVTCKNCKYVMFFDAHELGFV
jgi:predicted nucleic-acid-binding Zn-ribbon protein